MQMQTLKSNKFFNSIKIKTPESLIIESATHQDPNFQTKYLHVPLQILTNNRLQTHQENIPKSKNNKILKTEKD